MSGYIGEAPLPLVTQILTAGDFTSATDTIPVPGGYTVGNIKVYINGDRLRQVDFTAADGINVVLGAVFPIGTSYEVEEQRGFLQSEAAPLLNADFLSMPAVNGDPIVESGSNADGEWTRWADGTQTARNSFVFTATGGLAAEVIAGNPWPVPFTQRPSLSIAHEQIVGNSPGRNNLPYFYNSETDATSYRCGVIEKDAGTGTAAGDVGLDVGGFGYWK